MLGHLRGFQRVNNGCSQCERGSHGGRIASRDRNRGKETAVIVKQRDNELGTGTAVMEIKRRASLWRWNLTVEGEGQGGIHLNSTTCTGDREVAILIEVVKLGGVCVCVTQDVGR